MSLNTTNGSVRHFKSRKPIAWGMQVSGKNITISDTIIDAVSDSQGFPFNTDGFDVGGSDIRILNSVIFNGDDAIAVQAGADNVLFQGGTIGYQSHGMSIGSLGQNQAKWANVSNIKFDDITVINAVYAARFKSWVGGKGLAKNITWSNIRVYNVTFPIFVTQTYINQGSAQTQLENGTTVGRPNNSTVNMEDFTWANFTGTINTFNPGDGSCVSDVSIFVRGWFSSTTNFETAMLVQCRFAGFAAHRSRHHRVQHEHILQEFRA
jgi:polygalacturonase